MKLQMTDWMPSKPDFELFHVYCHHRDYRLCFALNEHFNYSLKRIEDFLEEEGKPELPTYAQFKYKDGIMHKEYFIIANRPLLKEVVANEGDLFPAEQPELLIPELPKVDYFFQLYGQFEEHELEEIADELSLIPVVIAVQRADTSSLKSYMNLMH